MACELQFLSQLQNNLSSHHSAAIASVCRIPSLYLLDNTIDITWDNSGAAKWSAIELNIGIICASLATLRPLFIKYWPKAFLSSLTSRRKAAHPEYNGAGQYYNMEGSIMVKKTIAVQSSKSVESGDGAKTDFISSHLEEPEIRSATPESQHGLSTTVSH